MTNFKSQFKYIATETVKHIATHYNMTNEQVMNKINEGKNSIYDEFTMIMVTTCNAMAK